MSKYDKPVIVWLTWAEYGDFINVAQSKRTGCLYVILRIPCGPVGAIWIRLRPEQQLTPYFTVVGNVRATVHEAKEACATCDAFEAKYEVFAEATAKLSPDAKQPDLILPEQKVSAE